MPLNRSLSVYSSTLSSSSSPSSSPNSSLNGSPSSSYISPYSSLSVPSFHSYSNDNIQNSRSPSTTIFQQQHPLILERIFSNQEQIPHSSSEIQVESTSSNTNYSKPLSLLSRSQSSIQIQPQCHSTTCDIICSELCRRQKIESAKGWLKKQEEVRARGY